MTRLILVLAAVPCLSAFAPAPAQFVVGPPHPHGFHGGYSSRAGFGFALGGPHLRVAGFSGGFVTRAVFLPPPPVAFGFGPPPFAGGWGPGFAFGPAVVAVPVPVPVPVGVENPAEPEPLPLPPPIPKAQDGALFPKGDFLVIAPRKDLPPHPEAKPAAKLPKPPGPVVVFDPFRPPPKVKAEVPEADAKREAARLVRLARESFAAGDYGRAAEHLDRAIAADPADAVPYFLHAQAKFAAGQYAGAVARIREGLARDPKWPAAPFDPTELYGDRPERFVLHLLALKKTLGENPAEATLEFLLGYQLWFSGDKAEAEKLFRAAEKRLPAPGPIALFK